MGSATILIVCVPVMHHCLEPGDKNTFDVLRVVPLPIELTLENPIVHFYLYFWFIHIIPFNE